MLQILFLDLGNILLNIGKGVRNILIAPNSRVKENLNDCLFFYLHFVRFVRNAFWYFCSLRVVDTVGRRLPVILDGTEMRCANEDHARVAGLHDVT